MEMWGREKKKGNLLQVFLVPRSSEFQKRNGFFHLLRIDLDKSGYLK